MFRHLFICLFSMFVLATGLIEARAINGSINEVEQEEDVNNNAEFQGIQSGVSGRVQGEVNGFQGGIQNRIQNGIPNRIQSRIPNRIQGIKRMERVHPANRLKARNSTETFKKALIGGVLGATGGIQAFEAGTSIIKSETEPFVHDGRSYNWDNHGKVESDEYQCSMSLSQFAKQQSNTSMNSTLASTNGSTPSLDQVLQSIQYQNGSRPEKIVWTCKRESEVCCGTDCCPPPPMIYVSYMGYKYQSDDIFDTIFDVLLFLFRTVVYIIIGLFPILVCMIVLNFVFEILGCGDDDLCLPN